MANIRVGKAKHGLGLIALKSLRPGSQILKLKGRLISLGVDAKIDKKTRDNSIRFGPETFLSPAGELGDYINHSCEPNACIKKIKNTLYLYCLKDIAEGEEVSMDYSTILGADDVWTMKCNGGNKVCRKRVKSFDALPSSLRQKYIEAGAVPRYILATI